MKADDLKNRAFEEMLRYAVNEANKELIDEMPPCEKVEFSKEHEAKMRKLFAGKVRRKKYIKRISIIAAVMVLLFSISVLSVQGLRIRFMNFILSFTETNTELRYTDENEDKNSYTVGDISLEYLPSGFALESTRNQGKFMFVNFSNNDNYIKLNIRKVNSVANVDTEEAGADLIIINGIKTFIVEKDTELALIWNTDTNAFELTGNIEKEELIKIAENIKIK